MNKDFGISDLNLMRNLGEFYKEPSIDFSDIVKIAERNIIEQRLQSLRQQMLEKDRKISILEKGVCEISDDKAEEEINDFIVKQKEKGLTKLNILDLMVELHLPASQIEKIMNKLKRKGIRELHG